eukprot:TRINITY_DN12961_c1_g2_i1.p1 TRINITY_DN12961_c1_g2~~TRINITY_DN12961_c1_g2_i1.p1  ORF type:complete len:263 (-),score=31.73 TRINITY_DN12961_c1_g2_i1:544-1239(-)
MVSACKHLLLLLVCTSLRGVLGGLGLDVSQAYSTGSWRCWKSINPGFTLAVVRAYRSSGVVDANAVQSLKNAHAAGYLYKHVYMFPCATGGGCPTAATQVNSMITNLKNGAAPFSKVWIDVEGTWTSSTTTNKNFLIAIIGALKARGYTTTQIGIYTSKSQWVPIMGSADFHSYALWYAHYDGVFNFNDFVSFNGWTNPSIKQYMGDQTVTCSGVRTPGADKNYFSSTAGF